MNLIRFLFILEKTVIAIIIAVFIPMAVYVYTAHQITVQPNFDTFYRNQLLSGNCLTTNNQCQELLKSIGPSLSANYRQNFVSYRDVTTYLMYFGIIPLIAHILIMMALDFCLKYKLRLTNSLLVVHEALIGIGIIVKGFYFNQSNQQTNQNLSQLYQKCTISGGGCKDTFKGYLNDFGDSDNISSTFSTIMTFLLVLQILCLIVIVLVNILISKYQTFQAEDLPTRGTTDYQLHTM